MSRHWPDRIRARLFDLGEYAAALDIGSAEHWISGYTIEIEEQELTALDVFEDVQSGEFLRRRVNTERNFTAWVYAYRWPLPDGLLQIESWPNQRQPPEAGTARKP